MKAKIFVFGTDTLDEKGVADLIKTMGEGKVIVKTAEELKNRGIPKEFDAYLISHGSMVYFGIQQQLEIRRRENPNSRFYLNLLASVSSEEEKIFDRVYDYVRIKESRQILNDFGINI